MRGALNQNRMSLISLAAKHFTGLDGFTQDYDAAYCKI